MLDNPEAVLADLRKAGFRLSGGSGRLWVEPASRLTPEQRAAVIQHKEAILALLAQEEADAEAMGRLWAYAAPLVPPSPIQSSAALEYDALAAWFLEELNAGRLPQMGPIRLTVAEVIDDPPTCWEWCRERIAQGILRTETTTFLKRLQEALRRSDRGPGSNQTNP